MVNPNQLGRSPFPASASQWMLVGLRSSVATTYLLSGPAGGGNGNVSDPFTVRLPSGGTVASAVTVTPSDGGGGGTFAPTTMSLTTVAPSATFTYTPMSTGAKTISVTNDLALSNPASLSYVVTGVIQHLLNTLISYWKMDEASGTRNDSQGTNHLGDTAGTNAFAAIINSGAYCGGGNYLSRASNSSLQVTGDFTIALWVRKDPPVNAGGFILGKGDASVGNDYLIRYDSTVGFQFSVGPPSNVISVGAPVTDFTWHYVVVWYDSADQKLRMRINDATTLAGPVVTLVQTTFDFYVGEAIFAGSYNAGTGFVGMVDEVGFWKRKLTAAEITILYNGGAGFPFSSFAA